MRKTRQRSAIDSALRKARRPLSPREVLEATRSSVRAIGLATVYRTLKLLVAEGIGTLVLGKNPFWKTKVELGKKHNQEFVQIPHATFLELLTYKAEIESRASL